MTNPEEEIIRALTSQLPNYAERLAERVGCPITELWMIFLAFTGRMQFPDYVDDGSERVPDVNLPDGRTRYDVWKSALLEIIEILGDPEARYRVGMDTSELRQKVEKYFT